MSKAANIKAAQKAVKEKDWDKAEDLCQRVLAVDRDNYNATVILAMAEFHRGHIDRSEELYKEAIAKDTKNQPVAWQGLVNLYRDIGRIDNYIFNVNKLATILMDLDERMRCEGVVNDMIKHVKSVGNPKQIKKALEILLPDNPISDYLTGLVPRPIDVYKELAAMVEKEEEERINKEISNRRFRLGAKKGEVSLEVKREVWMASPLESLYTNIINWADDEETRRNTDEKLLAHGYNKMLAFPPGEKKNEMRQKVQKWAEGLVILNYPSDLAWRIVLEWKDVQELGEHDVNELRQYIKFFPDSGLGLGLKAFLSSQLSPFPPVEEEENDEDDEDKRKDKKKGKRKKDKAKKKKEKPAEKATDSAEAQDAEETEEGEAEQITEGDESQLITLFADALEAGSKSPLCHRIVSAFFELISEHELAVDTARKGKDLLLLESKNSGLKLQKNIDAMSVILGTALIHYQSPKHHPEAGALFEDVLTRNSTYGAALVGLGLILEEQANYDGALDLLERALERDKDNIRIQSEVAWCKILMERYDEGLSELDACLKLVTGVDALSRDLRAQILWRIGTGIWNSDPENRNDRQGAYAFFISALQQNQNFAPAYTSLGIFFADIAEDTERANKCFQKAFELSAGEVEAAERLARSFAESKEWELVEIVARRVADADKKRSVPGKGVSWPQSAIGVVELNNQNYPLAIQAFQNALRISPTDFNAWVGLGEAYTNSGRYIAALKVFNQAQKLDSSNWFAKYMLANVHRDLGDYEEATQGYSEVLSIRENEFGVLIALCETLVASAFHSITKGFSNDAAKSATQVFDAGLRIVKERPDAFNLWKAVGDACLAFSWIKIRADEFPHKVLKELLETDIDRKEFDILSEVDDVTPSTLDQLETMAAPSRPVMGAILAFKRGIYASADDRHAHAVAWFNLGIAEFRAYITEPNNLTQYRQAAIHCFKRAIKLEPGNHDYWNALGVVTSELSARIAQHALIRSLHINDKNVQAWTNLGGLYLMEKDYELAHEAFSRAQSVDPDFAHAWVGQGLATLLAGADEAAEEHALELFEHAFKISDNFNTVVHRQFSNSSFDQLLRSHQEAAFASLLEPLFALEKLNQKLGSDSVILRLSSFFSERAMAFEGAREKLLIVADTIEAKFEESEDNEDLKRFVQTKADLARMYLGEKKYQEAVDNGTEALSLTDAEEGLEKARLSAHLTAGLGYYFLGQHEEALEMFKSALVESDSNPDVIVLLSQVLWARAGEAEREVAREQLFTVIESNTDHLPTLLSLATIGILDSNPDIIEAVVDDLYSVLGTELPRLTRHRVETLLSAIDLTQPSSSPLAATQTSIFLQPQNFENWSRLSQIAGDHHAAEVALRVVSASKDSSPVELAEALAGVGRVECDLKSVFVAPWCEAGWRGLAADVKVR